MIEKLKTLKWFAARPSHWHHAAALVVRKLTADRDTPALREQARRWASRRAVTVPQALQSIGLLPDPGSSQYPRMKEALLDEARDIENAAQIEMGGPGDLELLHAAVALSGAKRIVETGVAYGWSSLAILAAIEERGDARLVSVDMPYPKMGNEAYVGIVVPERMRNYWTLVRAPDRNGIRRALRLHGGKIDLCHYDSDKSWWGRSFAYPLLWDSLRPGGVFISDDIQDNLYFSEFVAEKGVSFAVTESQGKFVGIARKPN